MAKTRQREKWSSRAAFIVAAIGSAIGFGNVWRFPNLAFKYGGGAFFIPYLLALFVIGIPILILEISIGQYHQTGDAGAFGRVHRRFSGLGLSSVFLSFVIIVYYSVLIAWVCRMFIFSCDGSEDRWGNVSGQEAFDWFVNSVTGLGSAGANSAPTKLMWWNVLALAFVWLTVFLSLAFGVRWTGRIAFFTVGLPLVIIIILLIRAATLDGARDGIKEYIGRWDMRVLADQGKVWSEAVTQIFFSLSVAFGVMTAYGSYNDRDAPVFSSSIIIAISNSLFSFLSGFAVFGIIGYLAQRDGVPIREMRIGGPALMFGTYPVALSTLKGGGHWERLFFVGLYMLGIDSAFSMAEALVTVIHDTRMFNRLPRAVIVSVVCVVGFLCGLLYCTNTGLLFLDASDFYVNFMLLIVGFFECFAVGWMYGIDEQMKHVGMAPTLAFMGTNFLPVILASGVWFGAVKNDSLAPDGWSASDWSLMWGFISLVIGVVVGAIVTYILAERARRNDEVIGSLTTCEYYKELLVGNVLRLRSKLTGVVQWIPIVWFFLIRLLIPHLLLVLFANLAASETKKGESTFGHYEDLPRGYQALGISVFCVAVGIVVLGFLWPEAYECFSMASRKVDMEDEAVDIETTSSATGNKMEKGIAA